MAGSSNLDYLYASNANVSNFVSVKLSGNHNYLLWKTQMLCLMESHDMRGIVDADSALVDGTRTSSIMKKYNSLLKGWIFSSITEDVLVNVFNLDSAKDVWEKLNSIYHNPIISFQQDSAQRHSEAKEETNDKDVVSEEIETETKGEVSKKEERERMEGKKKLGKGIPEKHKDIGREELNSETQDRHYLYALNANVSNFVSVKLSGNHNYLLWKRQMLCLMESHDMRGIVDADSAFDGPRTSGINKKYDSLLTGWIFGSITEDMLVNVFNLDSAKDVWEKLNSMYDNPTSFSFQKAQTKPEANEETEDKYAISAEAETKDKCVVSAEGEAETETNSNISRNTEKEKQEKDRMERNKKLRKATMEGDWWEVKYILGKHEDAHREELNSDGNTVLHLAVGIGHKDFLKRLLELLKGEKVVEMKNKNESTALHIAAIVGNKYAAELLVERNKDLLKIKDNDGEEPLLKAYSNMQFDTFIYLWNAAKGDDKTKQNISRGLHIKKGVKLLVNAISAKQYSTASELVDKFPEFAVESDDVLMAIATTFPSGLTEGEKLIYPSLGDIDERISHRLRWLFVSFQLFVFPCAAIDTKHNIVVSILSSMLIVVPMAMLVFIYQLIRILVLMVYLPFFMLYFLSWKVATRVQVAPIKHIEKKKKEWEEAKRVLELVCNKTDELKFSGTHHSHYTRPILEAACQNAYPVVDEILYRSPQTIQSRDKNGYDIIELAVIHRSEKIFNLIYQLGERKSHYGTFKDSFENNILHLAGRLAPSHELNRRSGAALQLQRELQWREEVKKFLFPSYISEENIFKETPAMVFTREHEHLVKEGEKWMKTTAESCSITSALIITIVFAAAITVPGGINQETGTPLFTKDNAFTIFAISDAISLFTSCTSLLVFLSILTSRCAEQDFLVRLPRRLIIGFCTLLLSGTAMMIAFSTTLFLVFCRQKPWMLAPICGLASLPIVFFVAVQLILIVELFGSTYGRTFGKQSNSHPGRFNPNDVRGFFGR